MMSSFYVLIYMEKENKNTRCKGGIHSDDELNSSQTPSMEKKKYREQKISLVSRSRIVITNSSVNQRKKTGEKKKYKTTYVHICCVVIQCRKNPCVASHKLSTHREEVEEILKEKEEDKKLCSLWRFLFFFLNWNLNAKGIIQKRKTCVRIHYLLFQNRHKFIIL